MSQGPLCPNLSQKVQKEVSQIANHNLPCMMLKGGLSVNLNHLKSEMLSLPDGVCWAPSSRAEFLPPSASHPDSSGVHPGSSIMNSFQFAATFNTFNTVAEP